MVAFSARFTCCSSSVGNFHFGGSSQLFARGVQSKNLGYASTKKSKLLSNGTGSGSMNTCMPPTRYAEGAAIWVVQRLKTLNKPILWTTEIARSQYCGQSLVIFQRSIIMSLEKYCSFWLSLNHHNFG